VDVGIRLALLLVLVAPEASAQFANPPRLSYLAYLGLRDWAPSFAIDASGNAYVTGITGCDIAQVNPSGSILACLNTAAGEPLSAVALDSSGIYATSAGSISSPATVVKLSPDGSQTLYSTVIPGASPRAVAVDQSGRLYITGVARAAFSTTPGAFQPVLAPGSNSGAFALRLSSTGQTDYATYLSGDEGIAWSIMPNSQGQAWVCGTFRSGGSVLKLDANGANLLVSRSFGLRANFASIAVDANDTAYVAGSASGVVPTTPGALQPTLPPDIVGESGYVVKLNSSGDIVYATYMKFGGGYDTSANGIAIDAAGNAYLAINSIAPPADSPAFCGQNISDMMAVLSADGSTILASAYLNGVSSIALDGKGGVYAIETDATTEVAAAKFDVTAPASSLGFTCAGSAADTAQSPALLSEVAPGEVVILAGKGFTASTKVTFDGHQAPVLYADSAQITAVVPFEVSGPTTHAGLSNGQDAIMTALLVRAAIPTPFPGTVVNEDGNVNFSAHPAKAGSTISFYMTGAGLTTPPMADGTMGPLGPPYPVPNLSLSAYLEGIDNFRDILEAPVLAVSQAPGLIAGVVVVTVQIPATAPSKEMLLGLVMDDQYRTFAVPGLAPVHILPRRSRARMQPK